MEAPEEDVNVPSVEQKDKLNIKRKYNVKKGNPSNLLCQEVERMDVEEPTSFDDGACAMDVDKTEDREATVNEIVGGSEMIQDGDLTIDNGEQANVGPLKDKVDQPEPSEETQPNPKIKVKNKCGRPKKSETTQAIFSEIIQLLPTNGETSMSVENRKKLKEFFKGKKYIQCPKPGCDKKYNKDISYHYHIIRCFNDVHYTCTICRKKFTASNGLDYHMKHVHGNTDDDKTNDDDETEKQKDAVVPKENNEKGKNDYITTPCRRSTRIRTKRTGNEFEIIEGDDNLDDETEIADCYPTFQYSEYIQEIEETCGESTEATTENWEEKVAECLAQFRNSKTKKIHVQCPKNCGYAPRKISNFHKHLEKCTGERKIRRFKCTYCSDERVYLTLTGVKSHITKHFENDNHEEKKLNNMRATYNNAWIQNGGYADATKKWNKVCRTVQVFENLKAIADHWTSVQANELDQYLPLRRTSPTFCVQGLNESCYEVDHCSLPIFTSTTVNKDHCLNNLFFNVGGDIWAIEWVPIPDDQVMDQFLAISCHREHDKNHLVSSDVKENGVIQLWCLPRLKNNDIPEDGAKFSLGIAYEYGPIWDMKWCPSGAWEKLLRVPGEIKRLGLLAIASSDGIVRILSVPYPKLLLDKLGIEDQEDFRNLIFHATPVLQLSPGSSLRKYQNECGKLWCIAWQPDNDHSKLIGGYHDGTVAIWNLKTINPLMRKSANSYDTVYPYCHIQAHSCFVRCLAWCPSDSNYFATSSYDRLTKIWDIRNPCRPTSYSSNVSGFYSALYWPLHGATLFYSTDPVCGGINRAGTRAFEYHLEPTQQAPRASTYISHNTTIWDNDYSNWSSTLLSVDATGVIFYVILGKFHKSSHNKTIRRPVCRTVVEELNEENGEEGREGKTGYKLIFKDSNPISSNKTLRDKLLNELPLNNVDQPTHGALHKIRWNPNHSSYNWLATGGKSGLIRLININVF